MKKLLLSVFVLFFFSFMFFNCSGKDGGSEATFSTKSSGDEVSSSSSTSAQDELKKEVLALKEKIKRARDEEKRNKRLRNEKRKQVVTDIYLYVMDIPGDDEEKALERVKEKLDVLEVDGIKLSDAVKRYLITNNNFAIDLISVIIKYVDNPVRISKISSIEEAKREFRNKSYEIRFYANDKLAFYNVF